MKIITLPLPVLGFIISTRAALGAGLGLLLADRLSPDQRRKLGLTLVGIGVATTVPALVLAGRGTRRPRRSPVDSDRRPTGISRLPRKGDDEYL